MPDCICLTWDQPVHPYCRRRALLADDEIKEVEAVGREPLRLRYVRDSKRIMGLALWDVLSPKVPGYRYDNDSGFPTFSLGTLKKKGLI